MSNNKDQVVPGYINIITMINNKDQVVPGYSEIPVVAYIQYVDSDNNNTNTSDNDTDAYTYETFPDAVCRITINGLTQTFKISNTEMGVIITCIKKVFNNMFENININEIIVTNALIDYNDIREDDITNTQNMENILLEIFDNMLTVITKQFKDIGITDNYVIFKHTINLYEDLCFDVIKKKIILHYIELLLLDTSINSLISNMVLMKKKELNEMLIELYKEAGENIIKIKSFQPTKLIDVYYVDKLNRIKLAKIKTEDVHYFINVRANLCSCPDFKYRKLKSGLSCKHLLELRNKTRCIALIKQIPGLYNIDIPVKKMLQVAYCPNVKY